MLVIIHEVFRLGLRSSPVVPHCNLGGWCRENLSAGRSFAAVAPHTLYASPTKKVF